MVGFGGQFRLNAADGLLCGEFEPNVLTCVGEVEPSKCRCRHGTFQAGKCINEFAAIEFNMFLLPSCLLLIAGRTVIRFRTGKTLAEHIFILMHIPRSSSLIHLVSVSCPDASACMVANCDEQRGGKLRINILSTTRMYFT